MWSNKQDCISSHGLQPPEQSLDVKGNFVLIQEAFSADTRCWNMTGYVELACSKYLIKDKSKILPNAS